MNYIYPFLRTEYKYLDIHHDQQYLAYSEKNPDSLTAGQTPHFLKSKFKGYRDLSSAIKNVTQKTTFKNIKTGLMQFSAEKKIYRLKKNPFRFRF